MLFFSVNSSGNLYALKNSGVPEKLNGEIGPMVIKLYCVVRRLRARRWKSFTADTGEQEPGLISGLLDAVQECARGMTTRLLLSK